ncbi:MAG: hypothetical protein AUI48_04485 [Chloroflexi bacterium 13_1_40CM_2_68_14]|nr:MAG: hypothetical protein AUI48_04485 [Chloroflexi bacterium 13_1_40CM_2_68_14]
MSALITLAEESHRRCGKPVHQRKLHPDDARQRAALRRAREKQVPALVQESMRDAQAVGVAPGVLAVGRQRERLQLPEQGRGHGEEQQQTRGPCLDRDRSRLGHGGFLTMRSVAGVRAPAAGGGSTCETGREQQRARAASAAALTSTAGSAALRGLPWISLLQRRRAG